MSGFLQHQKAELFLISHSFSLEAFNVINALLQSQPIPSCVSGHQAIEASTVRGRRDGSVNKLLGVKA